jgi:hypothetical protein
LLLFIFFIQTLYSQEKQLSPDFKKIITIDKNNDGLIKSDPEKYSFNDLIYFFCIVSEKLDLFENYKIWFSDLNKKLDQSILKEFGRNDIENTDLKIQKKAAENILFFLHSSVFKYYNPDSSTIDLIIDKGEFNCVSSSILYAIFLKKYGFESFGIETSDHVFIEIEFQDEKIDVETTNKFGYDPGRKKEVLDDLGKLTGFSYVPAKDYKNRNKIDLKKLLFLVYHNSANLFFLKGNYIKASNLGYIISQGRNDNKGKEDFNAYLNNYLVILNNSKKYQQGIDLINSFLVYFGMMENLINLRFDLIGNFISDWIEYKNYEDIKNYLLNENEKYDNLKNNKRFLEIYFFFNYKTISFYSKNNNFDKAYLLIKEFNKLYKNSEMEKIFTNTLIDEAENYKKTRDIKLAMNRFLELKSIFPEYIDVINKNQKIILLNQVNELLNKGDYEKSLQFSKEIEVKYPNDNDVMLMIKNCYVKYSIYLFDKKDYDNAINVSETALSNYPDDKILKNNNKVFYQNFILELIQKKDFTKARKELNLAIIKYSDDINIIKLDKYLKENNY